MTFKSIEWLPVLQKENVKLPLRLVFDVECFQNAESAERFDFEFKERIIIFERIVVQTDLTTIKFLHWLHLNRLMTLMNLIN